jgi:hypothetical protein
MTPDLHIIGRCPFTDGSVREFFEDAESRQYVLDDDGNLVPGQWLPLADEPSIAMNPT